MTSMFINSVKTSSHAAEHMFYASLVNCEQKVCVVIFC